LKCTVTPCLSYHPQDVLHLILDQLQFHGYSKLKKPVLLIMPRFFQYRLDHIIFWMLTIGFHAYTRLPLMDKAGASQFILELILRNGLLACAIYLTILVAIPRLTQGNKIMGILYIGMAIAIYIFGKNTHDAYFEGPARSHFFHNTFYNLSIVTFYLAFATTFYSIQSTQSIFKSINIIIQPAKHLKNFRRCYGINFTSAAGLKSKLKKK
jgi:hypothetical protein